MGEYILIIRYSLVFAGQVQPGIQFSSQRHSSHVSVCGSKSHLHVLLLVVFAFFLEEDDDEEEELLPRFMSK